MPHIRTALRRALLMGGLLIATAHGLAADNLDPKLGRMVYAALQADEELADLNLGVKALQGGTVILWGPSPSAALTKKAVALLKDVPGVVAVKIECDRDGLIDPLVQKVETDVKGPAPDTKPMERSTVPPVAVTRQVTTVEKPRPDAPPPTTTLLPPTPVTSDTAILERLRKSEARFAKLILQDEGDRLIITGTSPDPADAWALAKKLQPHVVDKLIVVRRSR